MFCTFQTCCSFPFSVIKRFLNLNLLSSAALVGVMTMGVKGVAFLKELVVAHRFGTSDQVDAFIIAMLIPSMVSFALGNAFRDALVPVYAEKRLQDKTAAEKLISNTLWYCLAFLAALSLISFSFAEPIMTVVGSGFSPEKTALCSNLFRIVIPYTICVGVAGIFKGYLQAHDRFALAAAAPVLIPGTIMAILIFAQGEPKGAWLSWGTGIGSILMVLLLYWGCHRVTHRWLLQKPGRDAATIEVLKSASTLLAGTIVLECYLFVDAVMVASLPPGSVATLSYGERICGVFCIVGATVAQSLFPHVSDLVAQKDWDQLKRTVLGFSGLIIVGSLPVVLLFWYFSEPIVRVVFERGEFNATDTTNVADVLRFAGFQVPGAILLALAARVVMALRGNGYVLFSALVGLAVNIVLNIVFIDWYGVKGVALSTAMVNVLSAGLMFIYTARRLKRLDSDKESGSKTKD